MSAPSPSTPAPPEAHNNLGNIRKTQGRRDEAMACFERALAHKPGYAEAHYNMGNLFFDSAAPDAAAAHFQACLASDPKDSLGAGLLLARLGVLATPAQASKAHLEKHYADKSLNWDRGREYRGHELVAQALRQRMPRSGLTILDAGCGTGLVGVLLRDMAVRLDGVDFSPDMLEKAGAKRTYDHLHRDDIVAFMARTANTYDAIASAATLIHFGDLAPVFQAPRREGPETGRGFRLHAFSR